MLSYCIIDDDPVCRRMLENIIEDSALGKVVESNAGGQYGIESVLATQPDVVLIDLLMPEIDGLGMIAELTNREFQGKFVMISQIDNKEMVGEAYKTGVEFFIHKPINNVEVEAVLKNVKDQLELNRSVDEIKRSLAGLERLSPLSSAPVKEVQTVRDIVQYILMDIGLLGEAGSKDMAIAVEILMEKEMSIADFPSLKDLYGMIAVKNNPAMNKLELNREIKAIEQRLRRAVLAALTNLASLGLIDYSNPKFEHYAPLLFDFQDVRMKMSELEREGSQSRVKVNVKKFLQVLYIETLEKLKQK
ncbi:transcriptional regulator [Siminovitchia terrae]|uniref:Transcriptional regulator n=1 Tax=Siminovitchia terrae TaxID=1914933 RepID=A0ABQ4KYS1_SIMTE|nr:response regulator [Siminovitchia terrae]GIN92421.1 transcriptional regulator [Siminovitchia terrae]GIN97188.1 transcriptional regulator [Siminovitchia terrae]